MENPFSKIPIKQLLEETEEFQNNDEEFMNLQIKPAKLWEIPENNGPSMQCHVCFEYFWSAGRLAYHIIAVHEKNDTKRNNETVSEIPKIENNSKNHSMEPETNIKQEFDTGNGFSKAIISHRHSLLQMHLVFRKEGSVEVLHIQTWSL